jgi:hypothetical protein
MAMSKSSFHEAFFQGFSTAMFREKQILILHLSTATKRLCTQYFCRQCVCFFDWVFLVTPMAQCTDLLGISGENSTRISGGNPLGTQENLVIA